VICTIDEFSKEERSTNAMIPIRLNNSSEDKEEYSHAYYDNVLILVYNIGFNKDKKGSKELNIKEKKDLNNLIFKSWEDLYNIIDDLKNKIGYKDKIKIDFKSTVEETLSCLLLDTIFSSINYTKPKYKKNEKICLDKQLSKLLETKVGVKKLLKNLLALSKIIKMSRKADKWRGKKIEYDKEKKKEIFIPDSTFYICWYSELRELIDLYPNLTSQLYVYRLPGGGFTGDWRISLMKGSVSVNLGKEVLNLLCDEEEDYKRFLMGVGLPTNSRFYKGANFEKNLKSKFLAWPGSKLLFDGNNSLDTPLQVASSSHRYSNFIISMKKLIKEVI